MRSPKLRDNNFSTYDMVNGATYWIRKSHVQTRAEAQNAIEKAEAKRQRKFRRNAIQAGKS